MCNVRKLNNKDYKSYTQLRLQSLNESPYAFSDSYVDFVEQSDYLFAEEYCIKNSLGEHFILGCFSEENKLIGFLQFKRDIRRKARHKAMIYTMYVKPEFRNNGVGKMLIKKAFSYARLMPGLEQIHLWALHSKYGNASNFYKKIGFKSQGTVVKEDLKIGNEYIDAEYMIMHL